MALPQLRLQPPPAPPVGQLRRCTFRRVNAVQLADPRRRSATVYEAHCVYPDGRGVMPLGDLASARATCAGCPATGLFRPDED